MGIQKKLNLATYGIVAIAVLFAIIALTIKWGDCDFQFLEGPNNGDLFNVNFFLTKLTSNVADGSASYGEFTDSCVREAGGANDCPNCTSHGAGTIIVSIFGFIGVAAGVFLTLKNSSVVDSSERKWSFIGLGAIFVGSLFFLSAAFVFKNQCLQQYAEFTPCTTDGPGFGMMITSMVFLLIAIVVRLFAIVQFPQHAASDANGTESPGAAIDISADSDA